MQIYKRYALLVIFFATVSISNGKTCAIQNTDTIYGKPGPYQIIADTFKNSQSQEHLFYIFRPSGIKTLPPCILFCPKFGSGNPIEYDGFIKYLVSKGFVVFFPRYKSQIFTRRFIKVGIRTDEMFSLIAKNATAYIDTTRIGFIGHDYGAGILPAVVKQITQSSGWGSNGVFMYLMSPWYFAGISKRELQAYPPQIRVVIQVFQDDDINDPRIGSNLFQLLNLKPEQKAFYIVYSDVLNHCRLKSNFHLPLSKEADEGEDNIMDTLALYRTADALTRSVFYNDSAATDFVFGNGKNRSLTMGTWENNTPVKEMLATDNPQSFIPLQTYVNSWTSLRNPFTEVSISRERIKNIGNYIRKKISNALNFLEHKSKKEENSNPNDIDIFPNPILSGYGAEGPFAMHVDSFGNPSYHKDPVFLFSPENKNGPAPVIILLHGYTGQDYLYFEPLISHIVSRGFAVIYPTYPLFPLASSENKVYIKIDIVKKGLLECIDLNKNKLDTTRCAIIGQSFGGGMVPCIAWMMFNNLHWGSNGAFMYMTAPWYSFGISQKQLQSFPAHVKLLTVIFNDDRINDHQMAIDIFKTINIPSSEKDFITLYTDSSDGVAMHANHFVPYGTHYIYGEENLLDYNGIYKFFDGLADYAFNNSATGKLTALGDGSKEQTYMGEWGPNKPVRLCKVTDAPIVDRDELSFFYTWSNPLNPRKALYVNEFDTTIVQLRKSNKYNNDTVFQRP